MDGRKLSARVAVLGVVLAVLYCLQISWLSDAATLVIGVGACVGQAAGIRWHRPEARTPWWLFFSATVTFLIGITIRPWAVDQHGPASLSADVFTVAGYVCLVVSLSLFLRGRPPGRHTFTDGVIVAVGAGLLVMELLALPASRIATRATGVSLLAGLYPLWDVVILLLVLNVGFSTATRLPSFRYLAATMVCLFVGDLGYAVIGTQGKLYDSPLLDVPFLVGFTLIASAALHPTMAEVSSASARPVQAWSLPRLALIGPALATPIAVVGWAGLTDDRRDTDWLVLMAATAILMATLLTRAVSAVRSLSDIQRGLRHQALHDALTGLPNRSLFLNEVDALLRTARPGQQTWVLYIDLDGFKYVNDHWGHDTGDQVLIEVGRRLAGIAPHDHPVARLSGDEFAIAGPGAPAGAEVLAERILAELRRPIDVAGVELVVTASVGIAVVSDQPDGESLIRDADLAMYRAKGQGRNRSNHFTADMRRAVRQRVELELDLRTALARHELWVSFQPIVNCHTGDTVAAEALLRWTHPVRGAVPPNDFIPTAEETGLIEDIGEFVLLESMRQLARWREQGVLPDRFYVSVNASAPQLRDHRLQELVREVLEQERLGPERLVLEMTESILMADSDSVIEVLTGLRSLGIRLSVDDFGTGYSSLSYLSRFPVSAVKIDRAFVSGLGIRTDAEAIVRAVIAMARALRLDVVAEGVETEDQRRILDDLDVRLGQGWLWGRAEGPDRFAQLHLARPLVTADPSVAEVFPQAPAGNS
jgi:diguanylate cyclase (GGDEF)-like protein